MDEFKKDLEDYFCRFTFGQFVTLILIEIVTLFFVFYLGAHYGPDLLGSGRDRQANKKMNLPEEAPRSVDDIVGTPPVEYTYPEVLGQKDGQKTVHVKPSGLTAAEYEKQNAKKPIEPTPPPPEKPFEPKVVSPEPSPAGHPKIVSGEDVTETPEKTPAASKSTKGGKFAIQVGSYPSSGEAESSVGQWSKRGYSAYMASAEIPNKGTWYRVRLGSFATRQDAQKFLEKFKRKEKKVGIVVSSQ